MPAPERVRTWLLAVADGLTRSLRSAADRGRHLFGQATPEDSPGTGSVGAQEHVPSSQKIVAGDGMRFFHRADCPMAVGREWEAAPPGEHTQAGHVPCGMCRP